MLSSFSNTIDARMVECVEVVDEVQYLNDVELEIGIQDLFVGQRLPRNRVSTIDAHIPPMQRPRSIDTVKKVTKKSLMLSYFKKGKVTIGMRHASL